MSTAVLFMGLASVDPGRVSLNKWEGKVQFWFYESEPDTAHHCSITIPMGSTCLPPPAAALHALIRQRAGHAAANIE